MLIVKKEVQITVNESFDTKIFINILKAFLRQQKQPQLLSVIYYLLSYFKEGFPKENQP